MQVDLAVIGSGPGGYVAAIRAAQLGMKVVCIEQMQSFGGTCLNIGCIPSKALLETTHYYSFMIEHAKSLGIEASLSLDFAKMMERKNSVVKGITDGVKGLFKKNKVETVIGRGVLSGPNSIEVNGQTIQATYIILATGSVPTSLPFLPFDEKRIVSSTGALTLEKVPKKLVVIGAGVIGVELGSVYARLGSQVTFVEMLPQICGSLDQTIHQQFLPLLKKQGLTFHLETQVKKADIQEKGIVLSAESKEGALNLEADVVLVAVGRKPASENLGIEIEKTKSGQIVVDDHFRTSVPSIYAIGDLISGPMLAHRASEEGVLVAELIAGHEGKIDYMTLPNIIYTHPEFASVGFTEQEAKDFGLDIMTGICSLKSNGRAKAADDNEGLVKVIGDKASGKLLGMHILAGHASEMIGEGVVALKSRMTVEELANTFHGHPTLTEAIKEACLVAMGRPINL